MATSKLISSHLRRRSPLSILRHFSLHTPTSPPPPPPLPSFTPYTHSFRFFSSNSSDSFSTHEFNSVTVSELRNLGFTDGSDVTSAAAAAGGGLVEDSILPIRALVSLLDGYHDLTGLPWWIVIASSTMALRVTLFPWVVLQLHKLKEIGEAFPK